MACVLVWKENVCAQISQRDVVQGKNFQNIVNEYTSLLQKTVEIRKKNVDLEKEIKHLKSEQQRYPHDESIPIHSAKPAVVADLESKIMKLQEELTISYKTNSENATTLLQSAQKLREVQEQMKKKDEEVLQWKKKLEDCEDTCAALQEQLRAKELTLQVLREELQAIQTALVKSEERSKKLSQDNAELVHRWMVKMNEEAEKMNEANEFYNNMKKSFYRSGLEERADEQVAKYRPLSVEGSMLLSRSAFSIPQTPKRNYPGHQGEINSVAFNLTGSTIATGSSDKTVKLWDSRSGTSRSILSGAIQSVMCVDFSINDQFVLGASNDNATRLWSLDQGRVRHTLTGHIGKVYAGVFSGDTQRVVTGSHDRTLKIWDLNKGYCIRTVFCNSSCNDLSLSSDGGLVVSGHLDKALRFFDSKTGDCAFELVNAHSKSITSVCLSSDGHYILSNSRDNTLKMFDVRTYETVKVYRDDNYRNGLDWGRACLSPDGRYVASGGADGSVYIWDSQTAKIEQVLSGAHLATIYCVDWNPQGHQIVSCDRNGHIVIWE